MTFFVHGLNGHDLMPIKKIFNEPVVEKTTAIVPKRAIDETRQRSETDKHRQQDVAQAYQSIKELPQMQATVLANQIMSTPVVTLRPEMQVDAALAQFRTGKFRHLPMITAGGALVGIISDRDILHHLSGVTEYFQPQARQNRDELLLRLMKSPVLTASVDTDVRYIARLFVEQHVGTLPIVTGGELTGIVTRSDVLNAVMRHFVFELWV